MYCLLKPLSFARLPDSHVGVLPQTQQIDLGQYFAHVLLYLQYRNSSYILKYFTVLSL